MAVSAFARLPATGRVMGRLGAGVLVVMVLACLVTLPYTLGRPAEAAGGRAGPPPRFDAQNLDHALLPPAWARHAGDERQRRNSAEQAGGATAPSRRAARRAPGSERTASAGTCWSGAWRAGGSASGSGFPRP